MYRNPGPRRFFNPRPMQMNRPNRPPFDPGSAGYYPSAPPSQFRFKSSNVRGQRFPRSRFPSNRGRGRVPDHEFHPNLYFKESMLADPWKKLQHVIERSEDNKNLQQTERHEEHVKEETEDKPGEQASQT